MGAKIMAGVGSHRLQKDLHSFPAHKFERGYKIGISRDNYDGAHHLSQSEPGHIHPDPHINALLRNVQNEIIVS